MFNMAIWGRTDITIMEVSHPTNEHGWLTDGDSDMMPLWSAGNCMRKVLIDNDSLTDFKESDDDYGEDFAFYEKKCFYR